MVEKTLLVEKKKEMKEEEVEKKPLASQKLEEKKEEKVIVLKVEEKLEEKKPVKKELSIEELPGVGAATAEKLREAGFDTMLAIAVASPGELTEIAGLTEATARKIINTARSKMDMGFVSGDELLEKRKNILKINTNSQALNTLFGGGVESGAITECYGEFGSGKSSLAHQLAVNVQLSKEKGGAEGMIVWLDTESTFRPERIKQIAELNGLDPDKILKNIKVARCFNSDHQMLLADKVEDLINKDNLPIKLVIVDSLMGHFRSDFSGRGQLADRQQKLNKHLHTLQKLASTYNLVVYITNQVMSKPDTFFGDPTTAIGGHIVGHNCLAAGTLIQLADGTIQAIGDLFEPTTNQVISLDMKNGFAFCPKELKTLFVNVNLNEAYEIDAGSRITSSPTHRFFRLNREGLIEETYAQDLKEGDYLALTKEIKVKGKIQRLPKFEVDEVFEIPKLESQKLKSWLSDNKITRKEFCEEIGIRPRQLRRILNQNYPTNKKIIENINQQGNGQVLINTVQVETNKHHVTTIPEEFTPELSGILGYFIGDGNISQENYSISFRDERRDILEYYQKLMQTTFNLGGRIFKLKDKNCFELEVNSKAITKVLNYALLEAVRLVSQSRDECVKSFIKGFADAEGSVDKDRPRITISQKNERLLHIIQMLLLRFNIRSVFEESVNSDGDLIYNLRFDNRDCYSFGEKIGMTAKDKKEQINKWLQYGKKQKFNREAIPISRSYLINLLRRANIKPFSVLTYRSPEYKTVTKKNFEKIVSALEKKKLNPEVQKEVDWLKKLLNMPVRWEKIRKITRKENKELFYDLTIPGSENYIANSFIVHNSTYRVYLRKGKKGTRVAKMVDAPHLAETEAIFQVIDKGIVDVN